VNDYAATLLQIYATSVATPGKNEDQPRQIIVDKIMEKQRKRDV
jgi:hypothetical protein